VNDVEPSTGGSARPSLIIGRGLIRRCGRCGSRGIFADHFHLRERCPRCGYRFVREAGAFTGVLMLNMALTFGLMFLVFMGYVLWRGVTGDDVSIWPFAGVALVIAVALPILGYSFAWSTWVAIDLATRPLDPDEELEALEHEHADGADPGLGAGDPGQI
jgi:uncharacterized protein (DUF983 family)